MIGVTAGFSFACVLLLSTECSSEITCYNCQKMKRISVTSPRSETRTNKNKTVEIEHRLFAGQLNKRVKVLCWVMTHPKNHDNKARHIKATWGKRCDKLLFMSTIEDQSLPTVRLEVIADVRAFLWGKTKAAFRYIYEHHREDADWFLKADDDTFVVVENLKYMLSEYNTNDPIYFGCRFNKYTPQGYMSGGAGYVLSKETLDRLVTKGLASRKFCRAMDIGAEDVEIGRCLFNVGVRAVDTRDEVQRSRFLPFRPIHHLFPNINKSDWYWKYQYYPMIEGLGCCSDHAVTFHDVYPAMMYMLEYFLYRLHPYGFRHSNATLTK